MKKKIGVGPRCVYSPTSLLMVFLVGFNIRKDHVVCGPNSDLKRSMSYKCAGKSSFWLRASQPRNRNDKFKKSNDEYSFPFLTSCKFEETVRNLPVPRCVSLVQLIQLKLLRNSFEWRRHASVIKTFAERSRTQWTFILCRIRRHCDPKPNDSPVRVRAYLSSLFNSVPL